MTIPLREHGRARYEAARPACAANLLDLTPGKLIGYVWRICYIAVDAAHDGDLVAVFPKKRRYVIGSKRPLPDVGVLRWGPYGKPPTADAPCYANRANVRKLCAVIFAVLRDGKPYVCPAARNLPAPPASPCPETA